MNPLRPLLVASPLLFALAVTGCTSQTNDNFENPPPGPPASCTMSAAVTGCAGGSVGFVCAGDRPDDGDTNLVCDDGVPGAGGTTVYCCAPFGQYWNECTVDTHVPGCADDAFGFRCSGPESPDEADSSLACSAGTPSGGDTIYCCNSLVLPPACVACQADGAGCSAASGCCSGVCGGEDQATCAPPSCGSGGEVCSCRANGQACSAAGDCCSQVCAQGTCAPVGCGGPAAIQYTCAASTTPDQLDASLVCGPGPPGSFCCTVKPE
jgi:hypothetical protein